MKQFSVIASWRTYIFNLDYLSLCGGMWVRHKYGEDVAVFESRRSVLIQLTVARCGENARAGVLYVNVSRWEQVSMKI